MNSDSIAGALAGLAIIVAIILAIIFRQRRLAPSGAQPQRVKHSHGKDGQIDADFILNAIQDGVVMVARDNTIQSFNPAAAMITGWAETEAIGLDFHAVLQLLTAKGEPIPDQQHSFAQSLATGKAVRDNDVVLANKNGKKIPISLIVSPVTGSDGQSPVGVVGVFRDVAKEKEQEAQRSDFISTASHEMRTPLAAIEGYLALALNPKTAQVDENAKKYLEKATASTQQLSELFRDLLTSSKADDGRLISYPQVVELGEILEQTAEAARFHAQEKGLDLEYSVSSDQEAAGGKVLRPLYYANVDPNRIREVFQNIIDNAIKYTMSGNVVVRLTGDNSVIQIQVQDTGAGISAEDIPHLFQKFYRVDSSATRTVGGTGLGLYICRKIVELYSGRIWVESQPGKGSTFFINLPRLTAAEALEMQQRQAAVISPLEQPLDAGLNNATMSSS